jgi:hypothetical protein
MHIKYSDHNYFLSASSFTPLPPMVSPKESPFYAYVIIPPHFGVDFTYKREHVILVFLYLTYFTYFWLHPFSCDIISLSFVAE